MLLNSLEFLVIRSALRTMWIFCWLYVLNVVKLMKLLLPKQLQTVLTALIPSRITYALSQSRAAILPISKDSELMHSWNEPGSLGLLRHCIVSDLSEKSDTRLFTRLKNPVHCHYPILPKNNKSCQLVDSYTIGRVICSLICSLYCSL